MIIMTERLFAEKEITKIREAVKSSRLNFYLNESPFSVNFKIQKKISK